MSTGSMGETLDGGAQVRKIHLIFPDWCSVIPDHAVQFLLNLLHDVRELETHDPEVVER